MAKITEIPQNRLITVEWDEKKIYNFLVDLKRGTFFGYSAAFTKATILELAKKYGVIVEPLEEKHPLRKKYGEYVLRVVNPYKAPVSPVRAHFEDVYFMEQKKSPGNRKCRYSDCKKTISAGSAFLEITNLDELPSGRKAYKKTSLCNSCASKYIKTKIAHLLKIHGSSDLKIYKIMKIIDNE